MPFYVKSKFGYSEFYHTGEFDRSFPPDPYITENIEEAATWGTREGAQAWADQFGGEVVEISDVRSDSEKIAEYMLVKDALNKIRGVISNIK